MAAGGQLGAEPYGTIIALGGWAAANRGYINGRILLAGHDPSTIEFRWVIDMARVLVLETYRELGLKFQEAVDELDDRIVGVDGSAAPKRERPAPRPADNDASLAMLQAMMGGSDFGGPRG